MDSIDKAQQEQRAKAEALLRRLGAPERTAAPVTPALTPLKAVPASSDCKRFVPGAGTTVTVPCTE